MKRKIFIYHHLGLGDHFHCNGLIRYLVRNKLKGQKINIFSKKKYFKFVKFMYRDNKKITVIPISNNENKEKLIIKKFQENKNNKIIKIGFEYFDKFKNKSPTTIDMIFYKQFKISYSFRFKYSYWKRDKISENKLYNKLVKQKYAFVHDDPLRHFNISTKHIDPRLQIIRNSNKINIFDYGKIIENASEIHVMESSIRCMMETLNTNKAKHFLYDFKGGPWKSIPFINKNKKLIGSKKNWKFIKVKFQNNKKNFFKKLKFFSN